MYTIVIKMADGVETCERRASHTGHWKVEGRSPQGCYGESVIMGHGAAAQGSLDLQPRGLFGQ